MRKEEGALGARRGAAGGPAWRAWAANLPPCLLSLTLVFLGRQFICVHTLVWKSWDTARHSFGQVSRAPFGHYFTFGQGITLAPVNPLLAFRQLACSQSVGVSVTCAWAYRVRGTSTPARAKGDEFVLRIGGGGTNRSDAGLNLRGSWQQGHSASYNTPSRI
jgi:hypothetical protein